MKAAQGRTKTRLVTDPGRGPVITLIYQWRVRDRLGVPTIRARLNADPITYPPTDPAKGWTLAGIYKILANPKYTGYQVLGRRHKISPRKMVDVPPEKWIWSRQPTHPALVDKATWDTAQDIGAERGNVQDAEQPRTRPGRRYRYRGTAVVQNLQTAHDRLHPHLPRSPRHLHLLPVPPRPRPPGPHPRQPHPSPRRHPRRHPHDRHRLVLHRLRVRARPGRPARRPPSRHRRPARRPAGRTDPVAGPAARQKRDRPAGPGHRTGNPRRPRRPPPALGQRIRARYSELHTEHTTLQAQRDDIGTIVGDISDPALLDELPILGDILTDATADLAEQLFQAFHLQSVYSKELQQITIRVTITDAIPHAITRLLADPRITPAHPAPTATSQAFSPSTHP